MVVFIEGIGPVACVADRQFATGQHLIQVLDLEPFRESAEIGIQRVEAERERARVTLETTH